MVKFIKHGFVFYGAIAALIGISGFFAVVGVMAHRDLNAATAAETSNGLQQFVNRSPGERGATGIFKGKSNRDSAIIAALLNGKDEPRQRALGKVFDGPPGEAPAGLVDSQFDTVALGNLDFSPSALADIASLPEAVSGLPSSGFIGVPGSGGFGAFPPISAIGGGQPGGGVDMNPGNGPGEATPPDGGSEIPPAVGAVPEPDTWLLMLLGFFACGGALRRAKKTLLPGNSASRSCAQF